MIPFDTGKDMKKGLQGSGNVYFTPDSHVEIPKVVMVTESGDLGCDYVMRVIFVNGLTPYKRHARDKLPGQRRQGSLRFGYFADEHRDIQHESAKMAVTGHCGVMSQMGVWGATE